MADKYLKATGNWADNNTWSDTDGGAAGATFPVGGDNVYLTANGNGLTLTLGATAACDLLTASGGCTTTLAGTNTVTVGGNVTLLSSMTIVNTWTWTITGTGNLSADGITDLGAVNLNGTAHTVTGANTFTQLTCNNTGEVTLSDVQTITGALVLTAGTINGSNLNHTIGTLSSSNANTRVLTLGTGILILNGTAATTKWNTATSTNMTLTASSYTIILTNSGTNAQTLAGGGLTFNHVRVEGAGAYTLTITGNNTFEKFRNDSSVAVKTITVTPGTTQTIRRLQVFSKAGKVAIFNTGGASATFQEHRSYCELNHVSLTAIVAAEKYRYYAGNNSTDGTGNTNWIFTHKARSEDN